VFWKRPLVTIVFAVLAAGSAPGLTAAAQADGDRSTVVAGTGVPGSSGDGGAAADALLKHPTGVAVAGDGTVYISDGGNHVVRAVAPDGTIATVAGTGRTGETGGALADGSTATEVDLMLPQSLAVGVDGTLFIADAGRYQVLALSPDGRLSVKAGTGTKGFAGDGGPAVNAALGRPGGLAVAPGQTVYIGDLDSHRVRAVSADGVITTVAGNGGERFTAAGGAATAIPVGSPNSIAVAGDGAVWIATGLLLFRVKDEKLATVTVSGPTSAGEWGISESETWPPADSPLNNVGAVAADAGGVYVLDQQQRQVLRLGAGSTRGTVATLELEIPTPVTGPVAAASGSLYLVDNTGHRVHKFRAPSGGPDGGEPADDAATWWWLFAAAGAVFLLIVGGLVVRQRNR